MTTHPFDLTGKVALVTGAHRGLGFAIAQGLANAGADVVINGRNVEAVDAAVAKIGSRASARAFDITDREGARKAIAALEKEHGRIDILVNNAGIQRRAPMVDFKPEDWDALIATNLSAPFFLSQAVLPAMIARKAGKIIHVASLTSELGRPAIIPYTTTKGGMRQMTRGMAVELAQHNIQVNAIAPGYFATEMNTALIENAEFNAWVCKRTPAGRWGRPDELAGLAVFLASSAADYVTGQVIYVDGGFGVAM